MTLFLPQPQNPNEWEDNRGKTEENGKKPHFTPIILAEKPKLQNRPQITVRRPRMYRA